MNFLFSLLLLFSLSAQGAVDCQFALRSNVKLPESLKSAYFASLARAERKGIQVIPGLQQNFFPIVWHELFESERRILAKQLKIGNDMLVGHNDLHERINFIADLIEEYRDKHKVAVGLAHSYHDGSGQKYGEKKYSYHLKKVRAVLKRFKLGPRNSFDGMVLGTAAWLHDIVEDTPVDVATVRQLLGDIFADIVDKISNAPMPQEMIDLLVIQQQRELYSAERQALEDHNLYRKGITFQRTAKNQYASLLKVADRIANVEESLMSIHIRGNYAMFEKYKSEWPLFKEILQGSIVSRAEGVAMWNHLSQLMEDKAYAESMVWSRLTQGDFGQ